MSTEIGQIGNINFTRFGSGNGELSLQITGPNGYIQINNAECYKAVCIMAEFLKYNSSQKALKIHKRITDDKTLEKSILKDAIECERFIQDLKILEIPVRLLDY